VSDPQASLKEIKKTQDFLVAIDSDGCAFDSMEIKHKECFIPNIIKHWGLQSVSKYARAAAEFVNLYSKWRGVNRFPGLVRVFDLLSDWPDAMRREPKIPEAQSLRDWIERESLLGNPALKAEVAKSNDPILAQALAWSEAVNRTVGEIVEGVPPFPFVRESLEKINSSADAIVCSSTPFEALEREWVEHDIDKHVAVIAGQEMGKKAEHIRLASAGRYEAENILMIGDAPGDMRAARANDALFFPIRPGHEEESWKAFLDEALDRFFAGTYAGDYEAKLIADFDELLPETPPWKR
jgi:phosphoglycolate phosphatase-like HAD superfamily hydrolase